MACRELEFPRRVLRPWTERECALLRNYYPTRAGRAALERLLPHRTKGAIHCKADELGVRGSARWTERELDLVRVHFRLVSLERLGRMLPGRTRDAILLRAQKLGLRTHAPRGCVTFAEACRRAGYSWYALARILEWAGVRLRRIQGEVRRARWPQRFLDEDELREALDRWNATETVKGAARARDLPHPTLYAWLRDAGALSDDACGPHHRVPSEVVDRVVREHTRGDLVEHAARARGLDAGTLRRWLRAAGVPEPRPANGRSRTHWRVPPETVDRVVAARGRGR